MDLPRVLICSEDRRWSDGLQAKLSPKFDVVKIEDAPTRAELSVKDDTPPPDIVVWRVDRSKPLVESLYASLRQWAPSTRFVLAPADSADIEPIIRDVEQAASGCWWSELCEVTVPACQLSPGGRLLRLNSEMQQHFKSAKRGDDFRQVVERATEPGFPSEHPVARTLTTRKARCDFVETPTGHLQLVCLPDLLEDGSLRTISVLILDTRKRHQAFDFAKGKVYSDLDQLHDAIVECAAGLGYERARLFRYYSDRELFCGVASRGFQSQDREDRFRSAFQMSVRHDAPSADLLRDRVPALCIHDPSGIHRGKRSSIVRTYEQQTRNFAEELELEGAGRWIEAPLLIPGSDQVIGKLVVDNAAASDRLSIRDALDVGYLAVMAAGAIHALNERHKNALLTELFGLLPQIAFEKDPRCFYRTLATILSCEPGLQWEQVMLFIADPAGLQQATCEMALGGIDDRVRGDLMHRGLTLAKYVELARSSPAPQNDHLYENFVFKLSDYRTVRFGDGVETGGVIANLLAKTPDVPFVEIKVSQDAWCQTINEEIPGTFSSDRVFAFPLTKSFAFDVEMVADTVPTQPVGVVLVGMRNRQRHPEPQNLAFTRVVLDLLGMLIAQRWTSQRLTGMFGSLSAFHHPNLNRSWQQLKDACDESLRHPKDDAARLNYLDLAAKHEKNVEKIAIAQATMKNLGRVSETQLDFAEFLESSRDKWLMEWGSARRRCVLTLEVGEVPPGLLIDCDRLVLYDVLTCLLQNAVEASVRAGRDSVTVTISTGVDAGRSGGVEIVIADDGPGLDSEIEPYLFVKGVSGHRDGNGRGLALARAELLMYSGDLQLVQNHGSRAGAAFRILFHSEQAHVPSRSQWV